MDIITNILVPLAISAATAIFTVRLSLKRFYAERWWDRKLKAYTDIFEALYKLKNYSNIKYDEGINQKDLTPEESKRLQTQWRDSNDEVEKAIEIGSFTISEDAIDCLRRFQEHPRPLHLNGMMFEAASEESQILTDYIKELKEMASKDLKIKTANKMQ